MNAHWLSVLHNGNVLHAACFPSEASATVVAEFAAAVVTAFAEAEKSSTPSTTILTFEIAEGAPVTKVVLQ